MRHVDRSQTERLLQLSDLDPHFGAQLRVEIGQGLVEQQHGGFDHERAGDCHALQLTTGELVWRAGTVTCKAHPLERLVDARCDLGRWDLPGLQPIGHVFGDSVVREDRVVLKHHAGVAAMRGQGIDAPVVERNRAGFDIDEAGDHAQQRRLPAARRPKQREQLAMPDVERDVVHGPHRAEGAGQVFNPDPGHRISACSGSWSSAARAYRAGLLPI